MVDNKIFEIYIEDKESLKMYAYLDILILLVVVFAVFYRLRNILGTNPEEKNVIIISKNGEKELAKILKIKKAEVREEILKAAGHEEFETELEKIEGFSKPRFMSGAKKAFEIIVCAFANADLETLRSLTTPKTYKKFEEIILQRQSDGQIAETDFIGIDSAKIVDAKVSSKTAKIVVNFVSEQINLIKDAGGKILQGDENFVQKINDVWTFEQNLNEHNNMWLLSSTKK